MKTTVRKLKKKQAPKRRQIQNAAHPTAVSKVHTHFDAMCLPCSLTEESIPHVMLHYPSLKLHSFTGDTPKHGNMDLPNETVVASDGAGFPGANIKSISTGMQPT